MNSNYILIGFSFVFSTQINTNFHSLPFVTPLSKCQSSKQKEKHGLGGFESNVTITQNIKAKTICDITFQKFLHNQKGKRGFKDCLIKNFLL